MTAKQILAKRISVFPSDDGMTDEAIKRNVYAAMKKYAAEKCKEQRQLCADKIWNDKVPTMRTKGDNADIVLNTPSPKFD